MKKLYLYKGRGDKQCLSEYFAMVDDSDYEYLSQWRWFLMKLYHCDTTIRYARRYEGSPQKGTHKAILLHRFILGVTDREIKCDHIDGDGLNCVRDNLRECTHSQNMSHKINRKGTNKCGFIGVSKSNTHYTVTCKHNKKKHTLFGFSTPSEAALAYNYLAFSLKGEFAYMNDIYIQK